MPARQCLASITTTDVMKAYSKNNLSPRNAIIPTIAISSGLPVGGIPGKKLSGCQE